MTFKVAREVAGGSATSAAPNTTQHPLVVLMGNYKLRLSYEITEPVTSGHVHEFSMRLREVRETYTVSLCVPTVIPPCCFLLSLSLHSFQ